MHIVAGMCMPLMQGNMDCFNDLLRAAGLKPGDHNIAITTEGSPFDKYARENDFLHIFHMFNETGGRTSVCRFLLCTSLSALFLFNPLSSVLTLPPLPLWLMGAVPSAWCPLHLLVWNSMNSFEE